MKIYIGADHRGFRFKEDLKAWLAEDGKDIEDVGATELNEDDDYPVFASSVGRRVGEDAESLGVLLCGSGAGATAAVNKIKNIRGSVGFNPKQVGAARNDDNLNVLVLPADFLSYEQAKDLVSIFLNTSFDQSQERYQRRINQIKELEHND